MTIIFHLKPNVLEFLYKHLFRLKLIPQEQTHLRRVIKQVKEAYDQWEQYKQVRNLK